MFERHRKSGSVACLREVFAPGFRSKNRSQQDVMEKSFDPAGTTGVLFLSYIKEWKRFADQTIGRKERFFKRGEFMEHAAGKAGTGFCSRKST